MAGPSARAQCVHTTGAWFYIKKIKLTSVVRINPMPSPTTQLRNVIVVSQTLSASALIAIMPVMTQCQIASCCPMPNIIRMK